MKPQEQIDSWGLKAVKFDKGYLAVPTDKKVPMEYVIALDNVPRCGEEFQFALQTCFCKDEEQLVACITTASLVSRSKAAQHYAAGCI